MRKLFVLTVIAALATPGAAQAAITSLFGGDVSCSVQSGANAGERHCSGIFTTFDGAPIDVNVGFPPAPATGPDGDFPIVGVFHGWGGTKLGLTSGDMQEWLDDGYAVFSMSDRGWGLSCGGTDPKRLQPGVCDEGYNHLMDTRYEVRDAQEVFEALADQAATGATAGEGLIDPQAIAATGSSYGGGISVALGALKDRKMMGAHEGAGGANLDGYLVPWVSPLGKAMRIAAVQPDIPWTDLPYSLQPNGHTLDYVTDAVYLHRGRIGIMKQSFVAGLYALGQALSNYAPAGTDEDADLQTWYAAVNAGEPYDQNPLSQDIADELTRHHSGYYIDDSTAPAPMLISNGTTDDLFPPDEAVRFYNRTRANHPGTPISLIFLDVGHQRSQNKGADATYRRSQRQEWFDFYVKGTGPAPFDGVQMLSQVCGGPSAGPFQAATWASLAPGEVRIESAATQVIATDVPSDGPIGQAFDPIATNNACAATTATDQAGAASYRSDPVPAGGVTMAGSATILVDILSPSPTSQIAARLLDVNPSNNQQILVARGLYRPEVRPTTASCQVFQLHPNAYKFAEGHIVKLELLPHDQPYGRDSNGQGPITVENLRLRVPVLETPNGGFIQSPSDVVVPDGYTASGDLTVGIDTTSCVPPTTTTTTSTTTTTDTSTTTTTLPNQGLDLSKARVHAQRNATKKNGRVVAKGEFLTPPDITVPPNVSARIQDGANMDRAHVFESCQSKPNGKISCRDKTADGDYKGVFAPNAHTPELYRFRVGFKRLDTDGPFSPPMTVTLFHNSAVVRSDSVADCKSSSTKLRCKQ